MKPHVFAIPKNQSGVCHCHENYYQCRMLREVLVARTVVHEMYFDKFSIVQG